MRQCMTQFQSVAWDSVKFPPREDTWAFLPESKYILPTRLFFHGLPPPMVDQDCAITPNHGHQNCKISSLCIHRQWYLLSSLSTLIPSFSFFISFLICSLYIFLKGICILLYYYIAIVNNQNDYGIPFHCDQIAIK